MNKNKSIKYSILIIILIITAYIIANTIPPVSNSKPTIVYHVGEHITVDADLITTPNVTDVASFAKDTTSLNNSSVSDFDVSNWTNFNSLFYNSGVDQSLATWDIASMTSASGFLFGGQLSTANYDATLVGWEATLQAAYPSGVGYPATISIHFGSSQYTLGGAAEAARTSLISTFGWTITDGGGV